MKVGLLKWADKGYKKVGHARGQADLFGRISLMVWCEMKGEFPVGVNA